LELQCELSVSGRVATLHITWLNRDNSAIDCPSLLKFAIRQCNHGRINHSGSPIPT